MPDRHVRTWRERQVEQTAGGVERGFDHAFEAEIRLDRCFVEVAHAPAQLFGIVPPVPRLELEIAAIVLDQRLHGIAVRERAGPGRPPHFIEQIAHGRRGLRHGVIEPVVREIGIAEKLRAFGAQPHHLGNDRLVVGRTAVVATHDKAAKQFFA